MKRVASEELKQGREKKRKVEQLFTSVQISIYSRWYCEECKSYQDYLEYLLATDLIYDVENLRTKKLSSLSNDESNDDSKIILGYLEKVMQDTEFIEKHTSFKLRKYWPIIGLKHNTSKKNIDSIVKNGLFTPIEIASMGTIDSYGADRHIDAKESKYYLEQIADGSSAFPGIYVTAIRINSEQEDLQGQNYSKNYTVILDPYLLNRRDYHVNVLDDYGRILDKTFSYQNIADLLDHLEEYRIGEIIFHNHIEPIFIKKVWKRKDNYDDEEEYPTETSYYDSDPSRAYLKLLDKAKYSPRFCTISFDMHNKSALFRVARNCQVKPEEADQTWQDIRKKYKEFVLANTFPEPMYYPPFTSEYSPLSMEDEQEFEKFMV